jgi:hypothetical protein
MAREVIWADAAQENLEAAAYIHHDWSFYAASFVKRKKGGIKMSYQLFTRVSLAEDVPEYGLRKGDLATIVDRHEGGSDQELGYSLEVFNALGETIQMSGITLSCLSSTDSY